MNLIQRIAELDSTAISECLDTYGDFVWSMSRKFSATKKEAEEYSQKIFNYIWENAPKFDMDKQTEEEYISFLTMKWILQKNFQRRTVLDN